MAVRRHRSRNSGMVRGRVVDARNEGHREDTWERPGKLVCCKRVLVSCKAGDWRDFRRFLEKNGMWARFPGTVDARLKKPMGTQFCWMEVFGGLDAFVVLVRRKWVNMWEDVVLPCSGKREPKDYRPDGSKPYLKKG